MGALDWRHAGAEHGECQGHRQEGHKALPRLPHEELHPARNAGSGESARTQTHLRGHELWLLREQPHPPRPQAQDELQRLLEGVGRPSLCRPALLRAADDRIPQDHGRSPHAQARQLPQALRPAR